MNVNTNSYTIGFACAMVVLVAALLASTSIQLTPLQDRNIELEKKQNILQSVGIYVDREASEASYSKFIKEELVIDVEGNVLDGSAFNIDLGDELKKDINDQKLPLYVSTLEDSSKCFIIPLRGKGLWGPIWGFVALESDLKTIYGANFDHKSETPGLGAEIKYASYSDQYTGETISDTTGSFRPIIVVKDGSGSGINSKVDGITGGTITSKGVEEMTTRTLEVYVNYFKSLN